MIELQMQEVEQVNGGIIAILLLPAFHYGVLTGGALAGLGLWLAQ